MIYIGVDLGGTNIAAGTVDENGKILASASVPTGKERETGAIIQDMASLCKDVAKQAGYDIQDICAVGVGSPGTIDNNRGEVVYSNNIKMDHVPLAAELQKYLHLPVNLENDANAAAYGEYTACGIKADSFVFMTLGTGVGGGIILNGEIYRGFNGAGAEIGHMTLVHNGKLCTCGKHGCLEVYASATALIEQTKEKLAESAVMREWAEKNGGVNGRTAFECAEAGDPAAIAVRDQYISYVADGAASMINIFQPELLVIGGGVSKAGDALLIPLRDIAAKLDYNKYLTHTKIMTAKLYNDAGIVGAAMAAKNKIKHGGIKNEQHT